MRGTNARMGQVRPLNFNPRGDTMKLFSAHIEDLQALYIANLKKALDMEQKITNSLPDLIANSTDSELSEAFRIHL